MARLSHTLTHWWTWNVPLSTGILIAALGLAPLLVWALTSEQWLFLVALVLVGLVPVVVRWPVVSTFGLYALLACSFDALPLLEGSTLTKPVGVVTGAVLLAAGLMERRLGRPPSAALWWGLFMVWAVFSTAWALNPDLAFGRLKNALSLFFLYLVAVSFRPSRKELYWVCALTVLGGVMAAGAGYLFGFDEGATGHRARGRLIIGDQASNPNSLGRVLILPLGLAIGGFVGLRGVAQKAVAAGFLGLIGVGIYISMSRAALVALIAVIAAFLYRMRARWQIVVAVTILLVLSATMPDKFYERVVSVGAEDPSGAERLGVLEAGLASVERFGIVGAGLDSFVDVYKLYAASAQGWGPHNMYLLVLIELGIIGLVLMLAALGSHLLAVRNARKAGHGGVVLAALEAGCVGLLTLGLFSDQIWKKAFWLAWMLLTWAVYCERQSDRAEEARGFQQ
jgi:O-antigen ligase